MRIGVCALLAISASGGSAFAQTPVQPAPQTETTPGQPEPNSSPPTPLQERDQQIRQFDPLDRDDQDSQAGKDKIKADRDAEKRRAQSQAPIPGSIAASEQNSARRSGPEVIEDEDSAAPVQEYTGPAVLSRSYSISQPLLPEQVKWQESAGVSSVFDSGVARQVNADGSLGPVSTLIGTQLSWGFGGRHYFRRDQVSVNYTGNFSQYSGVGAYNGANNSVAVTYSHVLSRRLTLNLMASGSILSENSILENQPVGSETIANINLSSSPNIQIYDASVKQFSSQADLTWQATSRLSFSMGTSYFGIAYASPVGSNSPSLRGMTGQQARSDVNYRLTRKMTIGSYYSFSHYLYPDGFGSTAVNTAGAIFSYAFDRTTQIRFRGGLSQIESVDLQTVPINPVIAALLGVSTGAIDAYTTSKTGDFSVQFAKDFGHGATASLAYAHGVSPGNGLFQASEQESISANFATKVFRTYSFSASLGRDSLSSVSQTVSQNLGKYQSEYGQISLSRAYRRGVGLNLALEYRYFDVTGLGFVRNQLRITSGVTWGSGNGRLWPF